MINVKKEGLTTLQHLKNEMNYNLYHSRMHWRWNSCLQVVTCKAREDQIKEHCYNIKKWKWRKSFCKRKKGGGGEGAGSAISDILLNVS